MRGNKTKFVLQDATALQSKLLPLLRYQTYASIKIQQACQKWQNDWGLQKRNLEKLGYSEYCTTLQREGYTIPAHEMEALVDAQSAITIQMLGEVTRSQLPASLSCLGITWISNFFEPEDLDMSNTHIIQKYHLKAMEREGI